MKIAVTGGTGFLGRYLVDHFARAGHSLRLWHRPASDRGGFDEYAGSLEWTEGSLCDADSAGPLVDGCEILIHAGLDRPGVAFQGDEGDLATFAEANVVGSLRLFEAARAAGVRRIVFISSCAVHDKILGDRPLDETHPTWARSHYGAHKAAVEQFVYSMGLGESYPICALRPCGIHGLARPVEQNKWFNLVRRVVRGETVKCGTGGKEVHARDVAAAAGLLCEAPAEAIAGGAFNCCDQYVAAYDVAQIAQELSGSAATITGRRTQPKHQIDTAKIQRLGMTFGGEESLREFVGQLVAAIK